jgi:hypothetical protein
MSEQVPRVVIGMDPHKRSVTIEVMTADESVVGGGRFDTTVEGYAALLDYVAAWPQRVWAIEGCEGIGRHIGPPAPGGRAGHRRRAREAVCPGAGLRDRPGP